MVLFQYIAGIARANGKMFDTLLSDILYIENLGNYMQLYNKNPKIPIIIYGSLSSIVTEIDHTNFLQVHRSFIVNTR